MRYSSTINNVKAKEWGLTIQQAYLFSWFYELPSWASKVMIESEIFYFASKTKAVCELPILTDKTDTMYRYYKQLEELNLVVIKKFDGKDYISLTEKAKEWNFSQSDYSENNPNELGNLSENNSDLNPTYNDISINNNIEDKKQKKLFINSIWNDYQKVKEHFANKPDYVKKYAYCDLKYYINKVDLWSENSNTKRTDRGWIGTLVDFIDQAKTKGEMRTIEKPKKQQGHTNH